MFFALAALMLIAAQEPGPPLPGSPALATAAPVLAALPHTTLVGYPVSGGSPRAVREAMNEARPREESGQRFDGYTAWNYRTRWRTDGEGRCIPSSATVTIAFTVTLPELTSRARLNRSEREQWDRYFTALAGHEANHVRIGLAGAEAMQAGMRAAPDCDAMRAAVEQAGAAIREANGTYDAQTRHGRDEGAVYPR